MGFRKLLNALKGRDRRPVRRPHRRNPPRLAVEPLEDRAVPASFSISDVSIIEGDSGTRNAMVTVSLTGGGNTGGVSVGYTTASGTAAVGSDYTGVSGTLNFNKNATSKTILIPIVGDTIGESNETFFVNLRNPRKATITDGQGVVTILDDDTRISIGDVSLSEGHSDTTSYNFPVTISQARNQPVTVEYFTSDGDANADSDYEAVSGTLTIPAGQTSGTITVLVNGDRQSEWDEVFYVHLTNPNNGVIDDGFAIGWIVNDDPSIYVSDVYATEGNAGTTEFHFDVTLSVASQDPVTVDFATSDGLATIVGGDYASTSGTVTFAPGVTSQTITVLVNGDPAVEFDEHFLVNLSNPINADLSRGFAVGMILSDDNAVLHIGGWADYEPDPYNGSWTTFYFDVWLSAPAAETVTVDYATADGTAYDGYDYLGTSGTLIFAPGDTVQTITVSVLADWDYDWEEYFTVVLSSLSGNALLQPGWEVGYGTIYDNQGSWW